MRPWEKRKEADVVAPGASDRGNKVGLDGERLQGRGAGFFHALPACLPTHLGRCDSGTLVLAGGPARLLGKYLGRYPGTRRGRGCPFRCERLQRHQISYRKRPTT